MMDLGQALLLILLGLVAAGYGTLIGASGSFVLAPALLFFYPSESPERLVAVTLAVSFCSAASASVSYARQGRIDYKGGLVLVVGMVVGGLLGAVSTGLLSRRAFELLVGLFLISASLYQIGVAAVLRLHNHHHGNGGGNAAEDDEPSGILHTHIFHPLVGVGTSTVVGFIAGLVGIGGGPLLVPVMVRILHFSVRMATGTALLVILPQVLAGSLAHLWAGHMGSELWARVLLLALGMVAGAQLGSGFSSRLRSAVVLRILYLSLGAMGLALILRVLIQPNGF